MSSMEERINKLREERIAREKARIEKLREFNLKKYNNNDIPPHSHKLVKTNSVSTLKNVPAPVKNHLHINKRPSTAPVAGNAKTNHAGNVLINGSNNTKNQASSQLINANNNIKTNQLINGTNKTNQVSQNKTKVVENKTKVVENKTKVVENKTSLLRLNSYGKKDLKTETNKHPNVTYRKSIVPERTLKKTVEQSGNPENVQASEKIDERILKEIKITKSSKTNNLTKFAVKNAMRKSMSVPASKAIDKPILARKSMIPKTDTGKTESVFERLYKPKIDAKKTVNDIEKLQSDPNYLKKVIKNSTLIMSKNFDTKPVRRSISAVHFKRISRSEMQNCIHKWASIGDKLNKAHLTEDDIIQEEKVTSAVKSEVKKVKFMTPMSLMTPRPEELQARLKNWLQKRGKSLDSYHHLQCFGLHHMQTDSVPKFELYDEENKENIAMDSDSDDGSYQENMNDEKETLSDVHKIDIDKWRRVSSVSESVDFNESHNFNESTITSADTLTSSDELVIGALNDLADLLREGFDYQQSARWLRAIRSRFPYVTSTAAYWECRAALEETRGDLPASVSCWEQAIAKGTERSVVEANLDQLLDKFMQLKISPASGTQRQPNPKMVDVKNVFKSTIIRFAVQQAKLRESQTPVVTVTPVRRSGRLSHVASHRVCESLRHATKVAPDHRFTPNRNLVTSP